MLAAPSSLAAANAGSDGFHKSDEDDGVRKTATTTTSSAADEKVKRQIIILAGPTAVGKSDVAMNLLRQPTTTADHPTTKAASRLGSSSSSSRGILISADSVQVYRGVEIGANKAAVGSEERRRTVLIDLVDDDSNNYTTGDWYDDALLTIQRLMDWRNVEDNPPTAPAVAAALTADNVATTTGHYSGIHSSRLGRR
jgi:hypothetical protein